MVSSRCIIWADGCNVVARMERSEIREVADGTPPDYTSLPGLRGFRFNSSCRTSPAMTKSDGRYRFFQPPRWPGAPPVERGEGPNSGPDWRESVGWKILLPGAMPSEAGLREPGR